MRISKEDVIHVAKLARLQLSDEELERMTRELDCILAYMEQLRSVDTTGIEPTAHAMELSNVFREDEVCPSLDVEEALANAPRRRNDAFEVPRIIE